MDLVDLPAAPARRAMLPSLLLSCALLQGCGPGDEPEAAAPAAGEAVPTALALVADTPPAGDAGSPTAQVGAAAALLGLDGRNPNPGAISRGLGPTPHCPLGYTPPAVLTATRAAPMPAAGGVFYTEAELQTWRDRVRTGPFVEDGDYRPGSPGDWSRIAANTRTLLIRGESAWTAATPQAERGVHGSRARDAAFFHLVTGNPQVLAAVRTQLLEQLRNPLNAFAGTLCIKQPDGVTLDGHPHAASWLLRYAVSYDFVRRELPEGERLQIENFIRGNAYFLAANIDFGLDQLFPNRQRGDYALRRADAAPSGPEAGWWRKRHDTNGDCQVDGADAADAGPAYAYVRGDGSRGPRISALSQWYNNRRSTDAAAVGAIGLLLADEDLVANAKRYFMEWLTYSVWPDGSQGEYARNGDYCIPGQGPVYSQSNLQGAILLARALARQGDRSLAGFSTQAGLFGSQGGTAKSIERAADTYVKLATGRLDWYQDEPWKATPQPRPATALGSRVLHFGGAARGMDDYHELGMLPAAALLPAAQIDTLVLRAPPFGALAFPGATGNAAPTGFGAWTDAFNAMPAMLLLRP